MRRTSEPLTGIVNRVCALSGEGDDDGGCNGRKWRKKAAFILCCGAYVLHHDLTSYAGTSRLVRALHDRIKCMFPARRYYIRAQRESTGHGLGEG